MPNKRRGDAISKDKPITVRFTDDQRKIIKSLIGPLGGSEGDVIRSILVAWLSTDKGPLTEVIKKKLVEMM